MLDPWEKILETTILVIIFWCNGISGERADNATADFGPVGLSNHEYLTVGQRDWKKFTRTTQKDYAIEHRSDQSRSYYSSVPATPYIPAFDPISVLASLAFLAFLLQSFSALFDRTRSIMPTIISSRRSNSEYGEHFVDIEKRVLRALEEYASLSNDLLGNEKESVKSES
ncbi:hypothetical protein TSAR_001683 [Trichomalopsis sarcophagae]|uniref:Uncharacterized protein n=1 Tax=Trichomalopsis sarcophagae TaxID=543379 RepID=A0A232F170_9HYME|nr:hypothetical protein TSAR_001683 [Trichomalopsis sarcophagae]